MRMRPDLSILLLIVAACGAGCGAAPPEPAPTPARSEPVEDPPAGAPGNASDGDGAAMACASDADCMVGTPRDCCSTSCPGDELAWSRSAWAEYQAECAATTCMTEETLACRDEPHTNPTAACLDGRCVLHR